MDLSAPERNDGIGAQVTIWFLVTSVYSNHFDQLTTILGTTTPSLSVGCGLQVHVGWFLAAIDARTTPSPPPRVDNTASSFQHD